MIRYIRGTGRITPNGALIVETQSGIGFRIFIHAGSRFYKITDGSEVVVHTSMSVKEDSISLYGFADTEELETFELLITVSGIGAKGALAIMSALSLNELKRAIASGDAKSICKANGVGKKTAERLILELKDKVGSFDDFDTEPAIEDFDDGGSDARSEALAALVSLGYTRNEAASVINKIKGDGIRAEDYIKLALRKL